MADCPYARCIQERKHIRRELLRWTKNMVFVVGLERVAEELMGRRKWKQYSDNIYTSDTNNSSSTPTSDAAQQQLQLLQLQQLAQVQQQAKPADSPSQTLKENLANQLQTTTIQQKSTISAQTGGETSPLCADEVATTGGPENGRLAEVARENGETTGGGGAGDSRHENETIGQRLNHLLSNELRASDDEDQIRIKRERLDDDQKTILCPLDKDPKDSEGTKIKEEANSETTVKVTHGLLRVKKEEELQETPGPGGGAVGIVCPARPTSTPLHNNNNSSSNSNNNNNNNNNNGPSEQLQEQRSASTPPKKELVAFNAAAYVLGRRPSPPPEDWKPLDKCYFCLDGKLPNEEQPPLSPRSESSQSSRSAESPMSVQVDPMAASVVAAALSGTYPTLLPQWVLRHQDAAQIAAAAAAAAAAGHSENSGADQPLDLSAKPKISDNNISILDQQKIPLRMAAAIDPKAIFNSTCYRAKPRAQGGGAAGGGNAVPVATGGGGGRRTYTEDELQAALRDIQSGKLGTRRAAVLYGIPRSTLRNKVYKLAMERERDATLNNATSNNNNTATTQNNSSTNNNSTTPTSQNNNNNEVTAAVVLPSNSNNGLKHNSCADVIAAVATGTTTTNNSTITTPNTKRQNATTANAQLDEVDDKELSGAEEEKEVEKALLKPLLSLEDLVRFSHLEGGSGESLRALLQRGQTETGPGGATNEWSSFEHAGIGPYLQKMLAAAAPFKGMDPEIMRRLMNEDQKKMNVNGEQVQHLHHASLQHRLTAGQRGPMTNDDFNPTIEDEASDSGQGRPILKIPSYKPASSAGSSKNNVESVAAVAFAQQFAAAAAAANAVGTASPGLLERASPAFSGASSPTNSLIGKGMAVNFRDVIAKSISNKFQEGQSPSSGPAGAVQSMISETNPYKRGRFTPPHGQPQGQQSKQSAAAQQAAQDKQNKNASGGKGTRPKRGKYRNYDRDSLVEAVRAVQRGEMSVHRAGSYYGVPHSTLEYKVKERHLMRPRKRDQKQPDDKAKDAPMSSSATLRTTPSVSPEKKPMIKPPPSKPFAPASSANAASGVSGPNGMKMPSFIDGMPPLPFGHPFNFWSPTPFMPGPTAFMPGSGSNVPALIPEQYFASQRMRGLQDQQRNNAMSQQQQRDVAGATGASSDQEAGASNARTTSLIKSPREMAESLYEGGSAVNGSFLDNLIRSSLESGMPRDRSLADIRGGNSQQQQSENLSTSSTGSKVLIDQLCWNSRPNLVRPMQTDSCSEDEGGKPSRPERVPTVDLSSSPRHCTDEGSDRGLASPPTPLSLSRLSNSARDDENSRGSREREVQNGGGSEKEDERLHRASSDNSNSNISNCNSSGGGGGGSKKLNHFSDITTADNKLIFKNAVSSDNKKSACDSKLIIDHSSQQKTHQHQSNKDLVLGNSNGRPANALNSVSIPGDEEIDDEEEDDDGVRSPLPLLHHHNSQEQVLVAASPKPPVVVAMEEAAVE